MEILTQNTVVVTNDTELKNVLENDNGYDYIYFGSNIELTSSITINESKKNITIDGTYLQNKYQLTGINSTRQSDTIIANYNNKKIVIKNMDIIYTNPHGVIYVRGDHLYDNIETIYDNITFNGVQLAYNPFGILKIINSNITIKDTNNKEGQEVSECNQVIISGSTDINSSSHNYPLFTFRNDYENPYFIVKTNSIVNLTSINTEFMKGTSKLDITINHDSIVNLTTKNGFTYKGLYGSRNVLIDERSTFNFIENGHQDIPMWYIFGTITLEEDSNLYVINSYSSTPTDNYNMYFKSGSKIVLNNPKSLILYNKNANVIYTDSEVTFTFDLTRINMWNESIELSLAGCIDNLPNYYWYKEENNLKINGTINTNTTNIISHNLTSEELLFSLDNFNLCNKKQISVGSSYMNIHPIYSTNTTISGHVLINSRILIEYNNISKIIETKDDGSFEYILEDSLIDNAKITITSCVDGSFIYKKRSVSVPHGGEITLTNVNNNITYDLKPISTEPIILPKIDDITITIIDSRTISSDWKLYVHLTNPLKSKNNFYLLNAVIFKTLDNKIIILNEIPSLIYTGSNNEGNVLVTNVTWSKEKGFLLNLDNNFLEINEEYNTKIIWSIQE